MGVSSTCYTRCKTDVGVLIMSCKGHNRIEYKNGQMIGKCVLLYETASVISPTNGSRSRFGLFKCPYCGAEFHSRIATVKCGDTVSCGCYGRYQRSNSVRKHGMKNHWLYSTWYNMRRRCRASSDRNYHNYGGRGIDVCDKWYDDFKAFYDYVSKLPHYSEAGYTLDRIENNGNISLLEM